MLINKTTNTELLVNELPKKQTTLPTCMGCKSSDNLHYYSGRLCGRKKSFIVCDECFNGLEKSLLDVDKYVLQMMNGGLNHAPKDPSK